jgi:uncharacterized protein YdeI (YjbR/CyaY-like superfamily)
MKPIFFKSTAEFRKWLDKNHLKKTEVLVGFYKLGTGRSSMNWSDSVDQALCFGWIDGVRRSVDTESYCQRFTPRKQGSIWSAINIKKMTDLIERGLVKPAGKKAFDLRKESRMNVYAHEKEIIEFDVKQQKLFRKNKIAWDFFIKQPPGYKKNMTHWVSSAKKEETQLSRLEKLIRTSSQLKRIL